jgi:single-strand DNA-binding protein
MLIGNLGKDPEIRVSQQSGNKSVSFSLATSRRYRDNNGEQKEDTQWHNIVGWGKIADVVEQLGIHKGMSLYVEGRLTNRSWTDQASGQKRYVTEVALDTFQILTPRQQANGNGYGAPQQRSTYQQQQQSQGFDDDVDLPF